MFISIQLLNSLNHDLELKYVMTSFYVFFLYRNSTTKNICIKNRLYACCGSEKIHKKASYTIKEIGFFCNVF